jgi:hypothetical protein
MKQGTIALVSTAMVLAAATVLHAQPLPPMGGPPVHYDERVYYGSRIAAPPPHVYTPEDYAPEDLAMPPYEVAAILRSRGFLPLGGPVRRRGFYVVAAIHPNGGDGRAVIDAHTGRLVRFVPALESRARNDEMVLVYRGRTFPSLNALRSGPPPSTMRGAPRPPARVPGVASRNPRPAPLVTPKPRPQAAPRKPETAQAPPVPAPVETKPAAMSPPLEGKTLTKEPSRPVVQPTQPLPPVQTME